MADLDVELSRLRERSQALFGAQYRLEVGAAIADGDGIVCIKDLADDLGDPPGRGSTNAELKILERSGLLHRATRTKGERRVWLIRQDSIYWAFCQEVRNNLMPSIDRGRKRRRRPVSP